MDDKEPKQPDVINAWVSPGANNVKLIYLLYLVSFVLGITGLVGVVFAYVNRGQSADWIETHYTYLIRTFWIGLLYFLIALILAVMIIGLLLPFAVAVWVIVRCVVGLQKVSRQEPVANPRSWWI